MKKLIILNRQWTGLCKKTCLYAFDFAFSCNCAFIPSGHKRTWTTHGLMRFILSRSFVQKQRSRKRLREGRCWRGKINQSHFGLCVCVICFGRAPEEGPSADEAWNEVRSSGYSWTALSQRYYVIWTYHITLSGSHLVRNCHMCPTYGEEYHFQRHKVSNKFLKFCCRIGVSTLTYSISQKFGNTISKQWFSWLFYSVNSQWRCHKLCMHTWNY